MWMKTVIQCYHPDGFILDMIAHDWLFAHPTFWSKNSKKTFVLISISNTVEWPIYLLMKVFNTMHPIGCVNRKRNSIQTLATNHATKTRRMVRFSSGAQNSIQNGFLAYATFLQSVLKFSIPTPLSIPNFNSANHLPSSPLSNTGDPLTNKKVSPVS